MFWNQTLQLIKTFNQKYWNVALKLILFSEYHILEQNVAKSQWKAWFKTLISSATVKASLNQRQKTTLHSWFDYKNSDRHSCRVDDFAGNQELDSESKCRYLKEPKSNNNQVSVLYTVTEPIVFQVCNSLWLCFYCKRNCITLKKKLEKYNRLCGVYNVFLQKYFPSKFLLYGPLTKIMRRSKLDNVAINFLKSRSVLPKPRKHSRRTVLSFSRKTQKLHTLIPKNDVPEPKARLL